MAKKRKITKLRKGKIIDVVELQDGNYGAPGLPRKDKRKPTKEQMIQVNLLNKARRCRLKLIEYFDKDDFLVSWTYKLEKRPECMNVAKKHFQQGMRRVRAFYKKQGYENFWVKNIEEGTKGAWHIHLVLKNIPGAECIIRQAWEHGGVYLVDIKNSKYYDEDFTRLSNYMTKDENSIEYKEDGTRAKSKIKQASYSTSRNMQLPEPEVEKVILWMEEVKPWDGYYIVKESYYEGENPATGFPYRRYTMIRIRGDDG